MTDQTLRQTRSSRAAFERDRLLTKAPVSTQERDSLIASRPKPVLETHLTPGGNVERVVRQEIEADREVRIGFINKRLMRQNGKAREDFNRSR